MKTTFLNDNAEKNLQEVAEKYFQSRLEDLKFFERFNHVEDEAEFVEALKDLDELEEIKDAIQHWETNTREFHNYGLSFDKPEFPDFDESEDDDTEKEPYYRYQLGWGGPSDEIRFYEDGTIEYVYMDWFCGIGFDVSDVDGIEWLLDYFESCDMINWDRDREEAY